MTLARRLEEGLPIIEHNDLERRVDRAQKRYFSAIKILAVVRRFARPSIQVNVADKQVNIAK